MGKWPFGQSQLFFFVGQEVVKGFDFVYPARHRQYEPAEGGMGDFVEVEQQPAGVVHAVAAHEDLDPCGHGLGENGLDGLAPGGLVAGADAVFYVQDDGARTGGEGRSLVVQLEEIRAAHVHGAVMGRGAGGPLRGPRRPKHRMRREWVVSWQGGSMGKTVATRRGAFHTLSMTIVMGEGDF